MHVADGWEGMEEEPALVEARKPELVGRRQFVIGDDAIGDGGPELHKPRQKRVAIVERRQAVFFFGAAPSR